MRILYACFIILFLMLNQLASAQKVALVLSGGGARGLAHVGVLKALEENNIPIDYIVGTSMGGIVGGFYAAGYSASQIEQIVKSDYFQGWISGNIGDKYHYIYSKEHPNASWFSVNLEVDSTLNPSLNSNLANDMALNLVLAELLASSSEKAGYNFDSLFIPFRAMASDIFTQNQVILKSGSLSEALRATLTVPFFYKPIKVDNKYLFDGGVYNNFPVDVAKDEFNPDIIIGVNVSSKKYPEYPYHEDEKIINQSLMYLLLDKADLSRLGENDIYIEPNLTKYTGFDFTHAKNIVDSGYVETLSKIKEIEAKISRRNECEDVAAQRNEWVLSMKPLLFKDIQFNGFSHSQKRYLRSLFSGQKSVMDIHDIRSGYFKLASEEYFKNIYPNIIYKKDTEGFVLDIYGKGKKNLKTEVGGNIATRSISQLYLGFEYTTFNRLFFKYNLNFYTGRFYQSTQFSNRINLPTALQFYIEPEFTINHWNYLNSRDIIFNGNNPPIIDQIDRKMGINVGMPIGVRNKLLFKNFYISNTDRFSNTDQLVFTDTLDENRFSGFRHEISLSRSNLNRKQYASTGSAFKIAINYFSGTENYNPGSTSAVSYPQSTKRNWFRFNVTSEQYFRAGTKYTYGYLLESVVSNQPLFSNYRATLLNTPAFFPLQDSKTLFLSNFRAMSYVAAGLRNVYSIRRNLDFRMEFYAFKPIHDVVEEYSSEQNFKLTQVYFSGTTAAVYHSPIGPISLSVNYYDDNKNQWGVLLHVGYIIFNKRSLE